MKRKVLLVEYSNGDENFRVSNTDKDGVMELTAITNLSYFPLEKGLTIQVNIGTLESIINDDELNFRQV